MTTGLHLQATTGPITLVPRSPALRAILYVETVEGPLFIYLSEEAERKLREEVQGVPATVPTMVAPKDAT